MNLKNSFKIVTEGYGELAKSNIENKDMSATTLKTL